MAFWEDLAPLPKALMAYIMYFMHVCMQACLFVCCIYYVLLLLFVYSICCFCAFWFVCSFCCFIFSVCLSVCLLVRLCVFYFRMSIYFYVSSTLLRCPTTQRLQCRSFWVLLGDYDILAKKELDSSRWVESQYGMILD